MSQLHGHFLNKVKKR